MSNSLKILSLYFAICVVHIIASIWIGPFYYSNIINGVPNWLAYHLIQPMFVGPDWHDGPLARKLSYIAMFIYPFLLWGTVLLLLKIKRTKWVLLQTTVVSLHLVLTCLLWFGQQLN